MAGGISGVDLMENAGASFAQEIAQRWSPGRVSVLRGPGNKGGDGFVVARHLATAGWDVRLAFLRKHDHLKEEAAHHTALWSFSVARLTPDIPDGAKLVAAALTVAVS